MVIQWLMLALAGLNSRNVDNKFMGKCRAIPSIEPIKSNAVFVANSVGRIDAQRSCSGFILVISVRFQIGAYREFLLIESDSLASMAESCRDMFNFPNVRPPVLPDAPT